MIISPPIYNGVRIVNRPDPANCARLDRGVYPIINAFERNGMRIDPAHLMKVHAQATEEMEVLAAKVKDLTGVKDLNLGSPDQLSNLLFKELKLKNPGREKWTKSKTRLAADADVLKAMISCHPCIKPILDWRERAKIKSTYTVNLIAQADSNSRIHTDVSTTTTGTQRLASSRPNLQNIPIRTALGREIRNAFVADQGNKIGSVDASQIEMRMNAVDANCRNMLLCFWGRDDVYWQVAELTNHMEFSAAQRSESSTLCSGCDTPMVNESIADAKPKYRCHNSACTGFNKHLNHKKWYRQNAKVTALMVGYDASPGGLFDQFLSYGIQGYDEPKCEAEIREYFKGYPELLIARKAHHKRAFRWGRVWDMWGFTRPIPQVKSCMKGIVNEGLRQAGNLAGQGGAAGIIKLWMAMIWDEWIRYWHKYGIKLLMQVHDEIVAEGPEQALIDFFEWCAKTLRNMFTRYYDWFPCPLDASYGVGDSWGVADH